MFKLKSRFFNFPSHPVTLLVKKSGNQISRCDKKKLLTTSKELDLSTVCLNCSGTKDGD